MRAVVQRSFDVAVEQDVIPTNPLRGMRLRGLEKSAERTPPDLDVIAALIDAAERDEANAAFAMPIRLASACGMRLGEILALRWANVDLDSVESDDDPEAGPKIFVRESLDGSNMKVKSTKSVKGKRDIALDPDTVAALRLHRQKQREWAMLCGPGYDRAKDLVYRGPASGGGFWKSYAFSSQYVTFRRSLGVAQSFHDLRHKHGSQLIEEGVDARTVANRLGHSDPRFTMSRYVHSGREADKRAAALMGKALRAAASRAPAARGGVPSRETGGENDQKNAANVAS